MKQLSAWFISVGAAILFVIGGCPAAKPQLALPAQPDQYDTWAQGLQLEDPFYAELQRLQRLYTTEPDLAQATPKGYDGQYTLKSRIDGNRAGLVLTDRFTNEQWTLWFLDSTSPGAAAEAGTSPRNAPDDVKTVPDEPPAAPGAEAKPTASSPAASDVAKIEVMRDEATAGGYTMELSLDQGEVTVTIVARWVQGRYLQCTRELTLGGMDQSKQAEQGLAEWTLEGQWLPYRLAPGLAGPYGIVPDTEADGAWWKRVYPVEAMVPAVAAYDRTHGFMLAVSDDHPRKLDRSYDLGYAIPKGKAPGAQLRLAYSSYDGTRDVFDRPWLASGLPIRDSIVLEPLELTSKTADETLVEAESAEVIQHVADFVHAYHFVPKPPALPGPGAIVRASQLPDLASALQQGNTMAEGITQAAGPIGAKLCLWNAITALPAQAAQQKAGAQAAPEPLLQGIGIDDTGLARAKGLSQEQMQLLQQLKQGGLPVLAETSLRDFPFQKNLVGFPQLQPGWFVDESGMVLADRLASLKSGNDRGYPEVLEPNWRNAQALAWFTRKLTDDLARYPDVGGYLVQLPQRQYSPGWATPAMPLTGSYEAQNAVFQLHLGEAVRAARHDAWLLSDSMPSLGSPSWCGVMVPGSVSLLSRQTKEPRSSFLVPTQRLATFLLNRVFGVDPYILPEQALGSGVLRCVGSVNGYVLDCSLSAIAGFAPFTTHQLELSSAAGELRVLYCDAAVNGYTGGVERPAGFTKQVAVLPGRWEGATSIWVVFEGIGGSITVDKYNTITVKWDTGSWSGKLPVGYWEIIHPTKGLAIQPGDAVLILKKPIAPDSSPDSPLG
jgi:hypothetical protein